MKIFLKSICWIRRDLRLCDHRALYEACRQSNSVAVVFVFDKNILSKLRDKDDRRVTFIYESLQKLRAKLISRGSELVLRYGDPLEEIPKLCLQWQAQAVFCNRDYEVYAQNRDNNLAQHLGSCGVSFFSFKDQVVFEKGEVVNAAGNPYKIFTPYKNAWLKRLKELSGAAEEHKPNLQNLASCQSIQSILHQYTIEDIGFLRVPLWLESGMDGAQGRLKRFKSHLQDYKNNRDIPSLSGTSELSVHLRFGTLSVRQLVRLARDDGSLGAQCWLDELIWREFYQQLLALHPCLSQKHAFKEEYNNIVWPGSVEDFKRWCAGKTGFPLVDAAMRHFNRTGWMHNRLRMVVASFLVKDLLVDWRWGEEFFARYLLDFDQAANNGGWQWCASTGCDAQPYFRIFNPVSQSLKFDPRGEFIRANLPERAALSDKEIHAPYGDCVDHKQQRVKILQLFKGNGQTT